MRVLALRPDRPAGRVWKLGADARCAGFPAEGLWASERWLASLQPQPTGRSREHAALWPPGWEL